MPSVGKSRKIEMEIMNQTAIFNGPVELGLRTLMLLVEAYPRSLDIQSLVVLDYMLVHSGDFDGGPESIHPASPLRAGEVAIRGDLIQKGIHLFSSKGLLSQVVNEEGISYKAEDLAAVFLDAVKSTQANLLRDRAAWALDRMGNLDANEATSLLEASIGAWRTDFLVDLSIDEL